MLADVDQQIHGQKMHNAEGDRRSAQEHAEEIHEPRPDYRHPGLQGFSVDHRCHGVRCVVKTVYELEAERNCETENKQRQCSPSDRTVKYCHYRFSIVLITEAWLTDISISKYMDYGKKSGYFFVKAVSFCWIRSAFTRLNYSPNSLIF